MKESLCPIHITFSDQEILAVFVDDGTPSSGSNPVGEHRSQQIARNTTECNRIEVKPAGRIDGDKCPGKAQDRFTWNGDAGSGANHQNNDARVAKSAYERSNGVYQYV